MTQEEEIAKRIGPELSIGRYIFETHTPPHVGDRWKVEAEVVNLRTDFKSGFSMREFCFEIVVTRPLLERAKSLARQMETKTGPLAWIVQEGQLVVGIKSAPSLPFRTGERELQSQIQRLDFLFAQGRAMPDEAWVLSYVANYWTHLIPEGQTREYYRGETHGLRVALDFFDTVLSRPENAGMELLGVVLIAMTGVAAEYCRGLDPRLAPSPGWKSQRNIPSELHHPALQPFSITREEAAGLAAVEESRSEPAPHMGAGPAQFQSAVSHYVGADETPAFYQGLVHGLYLSVRIARLFRDRELVPRNRLIDHWMDGLTRLCGAAARSWLSIQQIAS